jgi:CRP-like cAMP-binding protein
MLERGRRCGFIARMNLFRHDPNARTIPAGSVVCRKGEPGHTMYAVVEGELEVVIGEQIVETLRAGETFGEMALVDGSPRSADVRAKTECRLVEVDEQRFKFLVQQNPFFALEVMRSLSQRLRRRQS